MDKNLELRLLNEQIEVLLEEYEEISGKKIDSIKIIRSTFDGPKKFEYKVNCI